MTLTLPTFDPAMPGTAQTVSILGVPMAFGCGTLGAEMGPAALRVAQLAQRVAALGYEVKDEGDVRIPRPSTQTQPLRYLDEIRETSETVMASVRDSLAAGQFPIVLGGDHSVAIGIMSGVSSHFRSLGQSVGLIWFDAHADMNTPETSPSGNIHGMPLSALLGHGHPDLVGLGGFAPKFDARFCAHIGARDLDAGERALIRQLGIRFFTMREIDERGMATCVREAISIASRAAGGYAVTFDVDALDPVVAPGSGTLVRGGLSYREAHLALEIIAESERMVALEMSEINTALDVNNRTAELGVELILSALGKTIL